MGSARSVKTWSNHHTYKLHTEFWGHNTVEICLHLIVFGENFTETCDKSNSLINWDTGFSVELSKSPQTMNVLIIFKTIGHSTLIPVVCHSMLSFL